MEPAVTVAAIAEVVEEFDVAVAGGERERGFFDPGFNVHFDTVAALEAA